MKLIPLMGILLFSCSKKAVFKVRNKTVHIYVTNSAITNIKEVVWKVGPKRRQKLSQGIRISFTLPAIGREALKYLYHKKKVDSWILRLRKKTLTSSKILNYFSITFAGPVPGNPQNIYYQSPRKGAIGINYAASAISMRLNALLCPALGHRKRIKKVRILSPKTRRHQLLTSTPADLDRIRRKVHPISYNPVTVNGGSEIRGNYHLDIAFYKKGSKTKVSNWVTLKNVASVEKVHEMVVKGCQNTDVPGNQDRGPVRKFKFGR